MSGNPRRQDPGGRRLSFGFGAPAAASTAESSSGYQNPAPGHPYAGTPDPNSGRQRKRRGRGQAKGTLKDASAVKGESCFGGATADDEETGWYDPSTIIWLRSAEGDVFEANADLVCRYSRLVRELLDENGPDEEIPLPGVKSSALVILLELCEQMKVFESKRPGGLRQEPPSPRTNDLDALLDVDWAAKLIGMEKPSVCVARSIARLLEKGECGSQPYMKLPELMLWRILAECCCAPCLLSQMTTCELIQAATERVDVGNSMLAVRSLVGALSSQDDVVCDAAMEGLFQIGTPDAHRALLTHRSSAIRSRTVRALTRECAETMELATQLLENERWEVRETALQAMVAVAVKGDCDDALQRFVPMLEDKCREVREAAVSALSRLAVPDDSSVVAAVVKRLGHEEWPIRCAALRALTKVAPDNLELLQDAATQLESGDGNSTVVKHYAARLRKSCDLQGIRSRCAAEVDVPPDESPQRAGTVGGMIHGTRPRWGDEY